MLTSTKDIEMWGDGKQTRSFTFIDDCVEGILRITKSDFKEPLNLGSSEMVKSISHSQLLPKSTIFIIIAQRPRCIACSKRLSSAVRI